MGLPNFTSQWGQGAGRRPPPVLGLDTNLLSIKRANSTRYHPGVMAIWQMRGAYHRKGSADADTASLRLRRGGAAPSLHV